MDVEDAILDLREDVAGLKANVTNLNGWQHTQNGSLQRIDDRVNGVYKVMLATASTAALSFLGTIITLLTVLSTK